MVSNKFILKKNPFGKRYSYFTNFKKYKKSLPKEIVSNIISYLKKPKPTYKKKIKDHTLLIKQNKIKDDFSNTTANYLIKIENKNKQKSFFLKEINAKKKYFPQFLMGLTGVNEMILLNLMSNYLKKNKVNIGEYQLKILQSHVAYEDYSNKKSYILYDFTNLYTFRKAKQENLISKEFEKKINKTLKEFSRKLNKDFKNNPKKYKKYHIKENQKFDDILARNIFIDFKKKKIFLTDGWLKN
jgi:hypothetical protein